MDFSEQHIQLRGRMHITLMSMQAQVKSYYHVVLPGKWNVRDAIPEREKKNTKLLTVE